MCISLVPHTHDTGPRISRRGALRAGMAALAGTALAAAPASSMNARGPHAVVDLTHRLRRQFPTFFGPQAAFDEVLFAHETDGFYGKRWTIDEHLGTHLDTPGHFGPGGALVDELDPATLIAPLAVVDITARALENPNAMVGVADLLAYERRYGRIPPGALVAMHSGWATRAGDGDAYRGGTGFPDLNFPGWSGEAAEWLGTRRQVVGIGVDTLSLDPGDSTTFDVHYGFLPAGGYGVENLANLDRVPPKGALAFVGPIPWEEGSGSPCRVLAVVHGRDT